MNNWKIVFTFAVGFMCANAFAGSQMYFVHNDHLNTPQVLTNSSQQVVWEVQSQSPFGEVVVDGDVDGDGEVVEFNLRFPGQYFDVETGTSYNYYRTYDPSLGRYIQSDPRGVLLDYSDPQRQIALQMGIQISGRGVSSVLNHNYGYVGQSPINFYDPSGEAIPLVAGCLASVACAGAVVTGSAALLESTTGAISRLGNAIADAVALCMDDGTSTDDLGESANDEEYDEPSCDDLLLLLKVSAIEILKRAEAGSDVTLLLISYRKMLRKLCETCPGQCAEAQGWGL